MIKAVFRRLLNRLGWVQLNVILGLIYFVIMTPYALVLRMLFRMKFLPESSWRPVEGGSSRLDNMRRSY
jgi:hypothetical protein